MIKYADDMKQWFKDFVHNTLVHPLMPFLPVAIANRIHDINATWAFGLNRYDEIKLEEGRRYESSTD